MPLRLLLLKCFGAMCNLDAAIISTLVNSVLPMELARDMQTHTQGELGLLSWGHWGHLPMRWITAALVACRCLAALCALGTWMPVFTVTQVITAINGECVGGDVSVQWCKALQFLNVPLVICVIAWRGLKARSELLQSAS